MQCHSCNAVLLDGTTTCPACGAIPQPDESKSPYELDDEAIPFIDYPGHRAASTSGPALQPVFAPTAYGGASSSSALPKAAPTGIPLSSQQPVAQHTQPRRSISAGVAALLVVLAFLLVGGSGFGYYLAKVQPAELNAQATSVVSNILTAQVQATTQAKSQALAAFTAKSPQDIYQQIINRKPDLSDPMSEQDGTTWVNFNESIQSCTFTGGAYHALSSKGFPLCLAENTNFSNLAYQARMTILHGDRGALLFRVDDLNYTFYRFNISRNGSYSLRVLHNNAPSDTVLSAGFNSVIATSEDRPDPSAVTVTIVAFDSFIYFYINGLFLTQVVDHTTSSGKIGVTAVQENNPTEVVFSNVKVWVL